MESDPDWSDSHSDGEVDTTETNDTNTDISNIDAQVEGGIECKPFSVLLGSRFKGIYELHYYKINTMAVVKYRMGSS